MKFKTALSILALTASSIGWASNPCKNLFKNSKLENMTVFEGANVLMNTTGKFGERTAETEKFEQALYNYRSSLENISFEPNKESSKGELQKGGADSTSQTHLFQKLNDPKVSLDEKRRIADKLKP